MHEIAFNEKSDLVFNKRQKLPYHTNGMRFSASDADGNRSNAFDSTSFDGQAVDGAICLNMPGATPC